MNRLINNNRNLKQQIASESFGKHVYPVIEEIVLHEDYAITFNPNMESRSFFEFRQFITDRIINLIPDDYKLYPEIGHNDQKWHLHGYIRFHDQFDIIKFYMNIHELKDLCTFKLRPIDNQEFTDAIQWYLYCRKQRHLLKPYIQKIYNHKLPYSFKRTILA